MKRKLLTLVTTIALGTIAYTACVHSSHSSITAGTAPDSSPNLVGLFLVKRDNTSNQYRAEVFPIAFHINNRYVDVSTDVTQEIRIGFEPDRLVELRENHSLLSAIQSFTVVDQGNELGQFTVEQLGVGQFACSSMLIGQGEFTGESLPALYDSLSAAHTSQLGGFIEGQKYDESWRSVIAIHQYTPSDTPILDPDSQAIDEAQWSADLLATAASLWTESNPGATSSEQVVERVRTFDLNGDGQPEVFGTVRQGRDPKTLTTEQIGQPGEAIVYANIWLSYLGEEPMVISSQVVPYEYPVTRIPYDVIGVVDITGNGIQEVIVQINDYESTSFGIYEFNGVELEQVFTGAGYGC
jgi:hypothetical protein